MRHTQKIADSHYPRVLPRDLFNEAKLLKDLGFLILRIQNKTAPSGLSFDKIRQERFVICQDQSTGDLFVSNVRVKIEDEFVYLYHPYNEKNSPSLRFECGKYQGKVFEIEGVFSESFKAMCDAYKEETHPSADTNND